MNFHFNKFERVAGLFVVVAFLALVASLLSVAVKQGWFENKIHYSTIFENAEGVHPGTVVQISGLKAGSVDEVDLTGENQIEVHFYILAKYDNKVRADSQASLIRPFVIGERVLDISPGLAAAEKMQAGARVKSSESTDILTLISGRHLGASLATMSDMMNNLQHLAEAFLNKERTSTFIKMFDRIDPLIRNLNAMSVEVVKLTKQLGHDDHLEHVMSNLAITTESLNAILPEFTDKAPKLAQDLSVMLGNMNTLTSEFKVIIPALAAIAPDLPRTSKRAVEALDESVVLMKSIERSFLVRGNVREVREEEQKSRAPASSP